MKDVLYLVDKDGDIKSVQLSYELWLKVKESVQAYLKEESSKTQLEQKKEALDDFKVLMEYWDFPYPYSPEVKCPHCGTQIENWEKDPTHTFLLTSASLGGLLVFYCTKCGTHIRHKYFKDHICLEHTPPQTK